MKLVTFGLFGGALSTFLCGTLLAKASIDRDLSEKLATEEKPLSIVAHLSGKIDLEKAIKIRQRDKRIEFIVKHLRELNQRKLQPILNLIKDKEDEVEEVTPLWLTNSVRVTASKAVVEELASINSISRLALDAPKPIDGLGAKHSIFIPPILNFSEPELSWGVKQVKAPEVWKLKHNGKPIMGQGITIAVLDTGINQEHKDLKPQLAFNPGEQGQDSKGNDKETNGVDDDQNGYIDDALGWNAEDKDTNIKDRFGHGTKVAGILVGSGSNGIQTGVAPKAKVLPIKACCSVSTTAVFESAIWEGLQYALVRKVDIISMSISVPHDSKPTYERWRRVGNILAAAEILHINSAGNRGNRKTPFNIGAPASNPPAWLHPDQEIIGGLSSTITVGANNENGVIRKYSSQGPVIWEEPSYGDYPFDGQKEFGLTKPELCAPSEIPSTNQFGSGYTKSFPGTSASAPVVAGAAALILSARPDLNLAEITEALLMGASPLKQSTGYDTQCGAGIVNVDDSLKYVNQHFPVR